MGWFGVRCVDSAQALPRAVQPHGLKQHGPTAEPVAMAPIDGQFIHLLMPCLPCSQRPQRVPKIARVSPASSTCCALSVQLGRSLHLPQLLLQPAEAMPHLQNREERWRDGCTAGRASLGRYSSQLRRWRCMGSTWRRYDMGRAEACWRERRTTVSAPAWVTIRPYASRTSVLDGTRSSASVKISLALSRLPPAISICACALYTAAWHGSAALPSANSSLARVALPCRGIDASSPRGPHVNDTL